VIKKTRLLSRLVFPLALTLGFATGLSEFEPLMGLASAVSQVFINLLKLISLPIIFLSIVSTLANMQGIDELRSLGRLVLKYTLLTTVLAATIALALFVTLKPAAAGMFLNLPANPMPLMDHSAGYLHYFMQMIPSNILQPFHEGNVIAVLLLAVGLGMAIISLPEEKRSVLQSFFSSLYAATMKATSFIVQGMPIAIWAFIALFVQDLKNGLSIQTLAVYLICIVLANLIQALIVLPLLLKLKGIPPFKTAKAMLPALVIAFWSKSSSGALPVALKCAQERLKLSSKVSNFSLPLCTTINMNACAAFILITVLFVSMVNGAIFSMGDYVMWIFISTLAAVGNAGVPMGCYFLASALLASMDVPVHLLGVILPFYALLDMLESAINVWSDACVTAIVDQDFKNS